MEYILLRKMIKYLEYNPFKGNQDNKNCDIGLTEGLFVTIPVGYRGGKSNFLAAVDAGTAMQWSFS